MALLSERITTSAFFAMSIAIGLVLATSHQTHAGDLVIAQTDGAEIEFWQSIKGSADPQEFEAYLQAYPNGKFVALARLRLKKLKSAQSGTKAKAQETPAPAKSPDASGFSALGAHQAAKAAEKRADYPAAARFYKRVLVRDPDNTKILDKALNAELISGNLTEAFGIAQKVVRQDPKHRMANISLGVRAFRSGKYHSAKIHFENGASGTLGQLTSTIAIAWIGAARRKFRAAVNSLPKALDDALLAPHYVYHRALISSLAGRSKTARTEFGRLFESSPELSAVALAYASHQSAMGNNKLARRIIDKHFKLAKTNDPNLVALLADVDAGRMANPPIDTPNEGLSELFRLLGSGLIDQNSNEIGLIYFQLALHLWPSSDDIKYGIGSSWSGFKNHTQAVLGFEQVARSSPYWAYAKIETAHSLHALGRVDEAISTLQATVVDKPDEYRLHQALGYLMRKEARFAEAADAYTRAISLIPEPNKSHGRLFYHRGISYERSNEWPKAEMDLRRSLELNSEQPLVLNYLGYSLIDRGIKPAEALHLIKRAVKLKPEDAYIVDSLGWAHYKMKDYQAAVQHLERAAKLRSDDPTILSHLGDAYWQTGQKEKAQLVWTKALEARPEKKLQASLNKKISEGLSPTGRSAPASASSSDNEDLEELETLE